MNNPYSFNSIPTSLTQVACRRQATRPESAIWELVGAGVGNVLFILNLDHDAKVPENGYRRGSEQQT